VIFVPLIKAESFREYIQSNQQRRRRGEMEPWENVRVDTEGLLNWLRGKKGTKKDAKEGKVVVFNREALGPPPDPPEDLTEEERMKRARKTVTDTAFMDPKDDSSESVREITPYAVARREGDEHTYEYQDLEQIQGDRSAG
jgi:hypothetical protein